MEKLAIILAAGEGTRMVSSTPKTLHEVCGIPMVEHVLRALDPVCPHQIMVVGHGKERVMAAYKGRIEFVEQTPGSWGTGHAARCALPLIDGKKGAVIIAAGDMPLVRSETFARLMHAVAHEGYAAAVLTEVVDNPIGYGRVVRTDGQVSGIVEQRDLTGDQHKINEINSAVYCFDIEALCWALPQLTNDNRAGEYYLTDVISLLYKDGRKLTTVPVLDKGECMGINNRVQLAAAEREMRERINSKHMLAGVTIIDPTRVSIQPDVMIGRDTIIHPGCELGRGTIIGEKCVLYANCLITDSTIGDGARIGNALIKHATVGQNARVEHAVVANAALEDGAVVEPFTCAGRL